MGRPRTGTIIQDKKTGALYARVRWKDQLGKTRTLKKVVEDRVSGQRVLRELLTQSEQEELLNPSESERAQQALTMTFNQLADEYTREKLKEAVIIGNRKVDGLKSLVNVKNHVKVLREAFGAAKLRNLSYGHIATFKLQRLEADLSIASVHRELETLRAMLRLAENRGWIALNPLNAGSAPLINKADEVRRERVLSQDEEKELLEAASTGKGAERRKHLKPLIILALDTGMRRGEMLKLQWKDVDFKVGVIRVLAQNTKTQRTRLVPLTKRASAALLELKDNDTQPEDTVFGVSDNVKRSFAGALTRAKLTDLHFHDLRHTAITRMVAAGIPHTEVMKISGHTQMATFQRYLNPTEKRIASLGTMLEQYLG